MHSTVVLSVLNCDMKHILFPQYNLNLICLTWTSQSEGHRETERHASYGKSTNRIQYCTYKDAERK